MNLPKKVISHFQKLSIEQIVNNGLNNTYAYVEGNPLVHIDPYGLRDNCTQCIHDCDMVYDWETDESQQFYNMQMDRCINMINSGGKGGGMCGAGVIFEYYYVEVRKNKNNQKQCILQCLNTCAEDSNESCPDK